ncbi:hypothetical protein Y032_0221g2581 [Ancylostoma ceylanicum]|uniref:Uncharacterized protein n=1 Tax=Ancylostoma ceylanicum TaxID=53326 RepID=A0A016SI41_9BILA|nr:hypothetical protein Y032_0221g2581 [Ancylostoma ceylanicum]
MLYAVSLGLSFLKHSRRDSRAADEANCVSRRCSTHFCPCQSVRNSFIIAMAELVSFDESMQALYQLTGTTGQSFQGQALGVGLIPGVSPALLQHFHAAQHPQLVAVSAANIQAQHGMVLSSGSSVMANQLESADKHKSTAQVILLITLHFWIKVSESDVVLLRRSLYPLNCIREDQDLVEE